MSSLLLLGVFVALIAVVSPSRKHDSLQNRTLPLATSVEALVRRNCLKPSLFVETSNELNVANGPNASGRELFAFPTSSPLQGAKGESSFPEFSSLSREILLWVVSVNGSRAEGTKRDATLHSHLPIVCAFIVLCFIELAVVYRHSDGARSISSVYRSSKKRESRQIVALSRTFLVVVLIAIASIEVGGSNAPDSGELVRCEDCSSPFNCTSRGLSLFISNESSNWFDAETECSKHGGALFSIRNKEDVSNLEDYLLRCQSSTLSRRELYMGLIRTPATEVDTYNYRWSDGSPFSSDPSEWSHSNDSVCSTVIVANGNVIEWGRAISCSTQLEYICQKQPKDQPFVGFPIRLLGVTPYRGHLEKFHMGAWTPVCMPTSSDKARRLIAADACQKMGYNDLLDVTLKLGFSACVYYNCTSNFLDPGNCTSFGGSGFVSCRVSDVDSIFARLSARGADRLRHPLSDRGLLVMPSDHYRFQIGGLWRDLCFSFDFENEIFIGLCRSLGFNHPLSRSYTYSRETTVKALMDCSSREIEECTVTEARDCNFIDSLHCSAHSGTARLVDGSHESEGRVEVYFYFSWASVCNDSWVVNNSNVVCRQLGYQKAVAVSARQRRLPLPSVDAMYHVRCNGKETSLNECAKERSSRSCNAAEVTCKEDEYCPSGWYLYGDYCYTVSNKLYTFHDTEWNKGCSYESLVSISSPHEQAFIVSLIAESDAHVWIGLTRRDSHGFHWVNGDRMTYALWANGEPSFSHHRKCVAIDSRTGYWKTADCDREMLKRMCKKPLVDFSNNVRLRKAPFRHQCRKDELYFKDACYYLSNDDDKPTSWALAYQKCNSRGAQLSAINSIHENAFIAKETSAKTGPIYWIGLVYDNTSSTFSWLYGAPVTFTRWAKYEPTYQSGKCVTFGFDGRDFTWSVSNCSTRAGYICKRALNNSSVEKNSTSSINYGYLCPSGWLKVDDRCFNRNDAFMTWRKSLANCESSANSGSLASILSVEEQSALSNFLSTNDAWIGLNDIANDGFYGWADGSPFSYVTWSSAEIKNSSRKISHSCVALNREGYWKASNCVEEKQSVCVIPTFPVILNKVDTCHEATAYTGTFSACKDCPFPFECTSRFSCLLISSASSNWFDAETECFNRGATLFSIGSKEDESDLEDYLGKVARRRWPGFERIELFLGLIRTPASAEDTQYNYRWSNGLPFSRDVFRWDSLKGPLCVTVIVERLENDVTITFGRTVSCLDQHEFICQKQRKSQALVVSRLVGVTANRRRLKMVYVKAWTSFCGIHEASPMAVGACVNMGYTEYRGFMFAKSEFISCQASDIGSIDVRFSKTQYYVVEIQIGSSWSKLCYKWRSLSYPYADNLCRSLGYYGGTGRTGGKDSGISMSCALDVKSIEECTFTEYQDKECYLVRIFCQKLDRYGNVRLRDGLRDSEGRVEIYFNESWSVVCGDSWYLDDANVVCRQLGYEVSVAVKARTRDLLSPTNSYARCKRNESAFIGCQKKSSRSCRKGAKVTCKENQYCPRGWYLYKDYCYTVSIKSYVFDDIEWDKGCNSKSLVSISNPHEQAFVLSLLADVHIDVWIGLTRRRNADEFYWLSGDPMTYALWASGEPRFRSHRKCVAIDSRTGYWKTLDCFDQVKLKRVCKRALVDFSNRVRLRRAPLRHLCRKDELYFKEACYYLSKDGDKPRSQTRAVQKCKDRDAHLVSISSIHENAFVAKETSSMTGPIYWIGLVYNNTSSAFAWLYGSPVTFTRWAKYGPKYENGACVAFGFDGLDFTWSVSNCANKAGYICKRALYDSSVQLNSTSSQNYVYMCPSGWLKIGDRCFKRIVALATWRESLAECQQFSSGSLASIHSVQEQSGLSDLLGANEAWIGLNNIDNEGIYVWADRSPLVYVSWRATEKLNSSMRISHSCVVARGNSWKRANCVEEKQRVCVRPAFLDFDECFNESHTCHENAKCKNTLLSHECICEQGFEGNGTSCRDFDECRDVENRRCRQKDQRCLNTVGSYECACVDGWSGNGTGHCFDVDECQRNDTCDPCATCTNTAGSYICTCNGGWTGNGSLCVDIDECESDPCHSLERCENEDGSFRCTCRPGLTRATGSAADKDAPCTDIDECQTPGQCHERANCTNTDGSYNCNCTSGWTGNGSLCVDIDECERKEDDICHDYATCRNTIGSYQCQCNDTFTGNGTHCQKPVPVLNLQISQLTISLSVAGSFAFLALLIIIAIAVYFRCNSGEYRSAEFLNSLVPNSPPDPCKRPDE